MDTLAAESSAERSFAMKVVSAKVAREGVQIDDMHACSATERLR